MTTYVANHPITHYDGSLGALNSVSGVTTTLPGNAYLGMERWEGGIKYRLVKEASNSAIEPGEGMGWFTTREPWNVTVTTVTEAAAGMIGVCRNATAPTGSYFWAATHGYPCHIKASNISLKTGHLVGPAAGGKFVTTDTVNNIVAKHMGLEVSSTAQTDGIGVKPDFFVFFEANAGCGIRNR